MSLRYLSPSEKDYILKSVYKFNTPLQSDIAKTLTRIQISLDNSSESIEKICRQIEKATIKPGFHIGVAVGQSLGQPITQMALSSFKKTGTQEFEAVNETSQLKNLLRWTKGNSNAISNLRIKPGFPSDVKSMKIYSKNIAVVRVADILKASSIADNKIKLTMNNDKRFDLRMTMTRISNRITETLRFKTEVESEIFGTMIADPEGSVESNFVHKSSRLASLMHFSSDSIISKEANPITKNIFDSICNVKISGIDGIAKVIIDKDRLIAIGPQLGQLMSLSFVDHTESISYDVWDVYQTLGIEAVRSVIVERIHTLAGLSYGSSDKNVCLLADQICARGYPIRIDKRGLVSINAGFLRMLSFENGIQILKKVAVKHTDTITDPSSKIIVGKPLTD